MGTAVLLTGSNIGIRERFLHEAKCIIADKAGSITAYSEIYESEPWGFDCEKRFLNMALMIETNLAPLQLLEIIHQIETSMGRIRKNKTYESRTIDIDIIFYDDIIMNTDNLVLPHPHFAERRFAITPVNDICDNWLHPVLKKSVKQMLDECKDKSQVALFTGHVNYY